MGERVLWGRWSEVGWLGSEVGWLGSEVGYVE